MIKNFNMSGEILKRRKKILSLLHVDVLSGQATCGTMLILLIGAMVISHVHAEKTEKRFKRSEMHNVSGFQSIGSSIHHELFSN